MTRVVRGVLAVGAVIAFAAFLALPTAQAQDATDDAATAARPESFGGAARASALDVALLTPDLLPLPGLFEFGLVEGRGTYESSSQEGRTSLLYPGNGAISGASLLCGTFVGPAIPPEGAALFGPVLDVCGQYEYPLTVYVDSLHPDGTTAGALQLGRSGDPLALDAVGASAHAGADGTVTRSQVSDLRLLGIPVIGALTPLLKVAGLVPLDDSLVAVDALTARTEQKLVGGRLSVTADTTIGGLRLLGGLVQIGSITSVSTLLTGGPGAPEVHSSFEVGGVTVAGIPAQITDDGLVVGDPSTSTGPIIQMVARAVSSALESLGFRLETLGVAQGESNGIPFAEAQGLLVEFTTPLTGLPAVPGPLGDIDLNGDYGVRLQLGSSGVRGFADTFVDDAGEDGGVVDDGFSTDGSTGGGTFDGLPPLTTTPDGSPTAGPDEAAAGPLRPISDRFADRMGLLYLSFTLGALALCLTPRLTLPARLPGAARI
jgi:hypothetical protein